MVEGVYEDDVLVFDIGIEFDVGFAVWEVADGGVAAFEIE